MIEPSTKRTIAFIDGQNLYHAAREAFGHTYPSYDVKVLSALVCRDQEWDLKQVRFYTGIPSQRDNDTWRKFWANKLGVMKNKGIFTFSRTLHYRNKPVKLPDGTVCTALVGEEKGIDVRIAIDIIRLAHDQEFDVALVFSQDQDLSEVAQEVRAIAKEQNRWIKIASAFPTSRPTWRPR